jgi:hypothetical protein
VGAPAYNSMNTRFKNYKDLILAILLILILSAVLIWFIFEIKNLYKSGALTVSGQVHHFRYVPAKPMLQVSQIQGWMTFHYINYIYHLPATFLKTKLDITSSSYPNLSLNEYISKNKLNGSTFIQTVRKEVASYFNGGSQ